MGEKKTTGESNKKMLTQEKKHPEEQTKKS
jgi:hypothetical protein